MFHYLPRFFRFVLTTLFIAATTALPAGETIATAGAALEVDSPPCEFRPGLFLPGWVGVQAVGDASAGGDDFPFKLAQGGREIVNGTATFAPAERGAIDAAYHFTAVTDAELLSLYVGAALPVHNWAGGTWECDGARGEIPRRHTGVVFVSRTVRALKLVSANSQQRLELTFPEPTQVLLQDDRQWGPTFSIRLGALGARKFKTGEKLSVRFTLATQGPQKLLLDAPVTITAGADWIPLKQEMEIAAGSALDFSSMNLADAPAGKHGRVIATGPHFEFEKKPGVPQRFYGVNLCFGANFLEPDEAERLTARLARTGYNALRLHHHDGGLVEGAADGTALNPAQLARLDALVAACAKHGIYVTTDLFVSRAVPWRAVGIERDGRIPMNTYKVLVPVHEGAFQNLADFTRQLLSHTNPHTGRAYAAEPALAWLALVNEGNFGNFMDEVRGIPEWHAAWEKWLARQRAEQPEAFREVPDELPGNYYAESPATAALTLFFADVEKNFVTRMKALLRDELGCRALVSDRSSWTNRVVDQVPRHELFDYVDDHFYVDHPQFIERDWRLPSRCDNRNPLKNAALGAQDVVFRRLLDKPFTITEYNYSGPGRFRGVGGIVTGALGALQDWGGIWRFAYGHSREGALNGGAMDYFNMANDPLSLAAERAAICLYLRGDLASRSDTFAIILPKNAVETMASRSPMNRAPWAWLAWKARLGTLVVDGKNNAKKSTAFTWSGTFPEIYATDSDAIRKQIRNGTPDNRAVEIDSDTGRFVLRTPRTCGGFTESGTVDAGDLVFDVNGTAATVWVSALDGKPVRESSRLLLTHLTDVQNSGIRYAQQARKTLLDWGGLPHLARNGTAAVSLAVSRPTGFKIYALSTGGRRVAPVPFSVRNGKIEFVADIAARPENATLLYEIVRE